MQNWFDRKPQIKETESMRKRKGSSIARLIAVPLVFWTAFISTPQAAGVIQALVDEFQEKIETRLAQFGQLVNDTPYPQLTLWATDPTNPNAWTQEEVAEWLQLIKKDRQELLGRTSKLARLFIAVSDTNFKTHPISLGETLEIQERLGSMNVEFINYSEIELATQRTAQTNVLLQSATEDTEQIKTNWYKHQASPPRNLKQKLQQQTEQAMQSNGTKYYIARGLIDPEYQSTSCTNQSFNQWLEHQPCPADVVSRPRSQQQEFPR
jgi:hypothetical protein